MYATLMLATARRPAVHALLTRSRLNRSVVARFVAGADVDAALTAVRPLVAGGLRITLDRLGEDVPTPARPTRRWPRAARSSTDWPARASRTARKCP